MSRFRITFSVDGTHLGDILARIHGQVTDLDVALVETVPHNKNVKRKKNQPRGATRELLLEALLNAPERSMTVADGKKILSNAGFVTDGIYTAIKALVKRGEIDYKNSIMRLKK